MTDEETKKNEEEEIRKETDWSMFTPRQQRFLKALRDTGGIISAACQKVNIHSRNTVYKWMKNEEFKAVVDEVNEGNIDYVESKLMKLISQDNPTAILFYLKTRGKKRGYVETIENQITVNPFQELLESMPDDE